MERHFNIFFNTNSFVSLQEKSAMEIWKDVKGYEGLYQVSSCGKVKSLSRIVKSRWGTDKFLKEKQIQEIVDFLGYSALSLSKDGIVKRLKIHRLVAQEFLKGEGQVNHKDGNKQNNHVDNLEFCTSQNNNRHAFETGLRPKKYNQQIICEQTGEVYASQAALARSIPISHTMVSSYMKGNFKSLKDKTYKYT